MNTDAMIAIPPSRPPSSVRVRRSERWLRASIGPGLLAGLGGLAIGCAAGATDSGASAEQVDEAPSALASTCVILVRGGPGGVSDTRVRQDMPTTPYGDVTTLVTGNQSTSRVVLLGFNLGPIPAGSVITSATVTLNEVLNQGPSTVSVRAATAAWSEATVTWNSFNSAYSAAELASFSNGGASATGPRSFGIAPLVQGWIDGAANHGIALLAPTNTTWSSSEAASDAQRPSLTVCYLPPAPAVVVSHGTFAAGWDHSLALKPDGTVWGVGRNFNGQLGDATTTYRSTPAKIGGFFDVAAIAAGYYHSVALRLDGTVWSTGWNIAGALGDGTTVDRSVPVRLGMLTGVTAVAAGWEHSLALRSDGTVWGVGGNYWGTLGDGTYTNRTSPVQLGALTGVTAIAAGALHSLALRSDGTVWAAGYNDWGQLGDGTTMYRSTPVQVLGLSGITAISAGWGHSLALRSDGTVWGVGFNSNGELGDGTTTDRTLPVQMLGLPGVTAIAAGTAYSLALRSDGTVWAVGLNYHGVLGDGTTTSRATVAQVGSLSGVVAMSAGGYDALLAKADGALWGVGDNAVGQLGDGTYGDRTTPVLSLLP
jgi:alpha-tubulin suppressor-like RCC1 family protein